MRFSIVIPVYNVESYLPDCLDSVTAQDFSDYEVVLVNDGSTDGSGDICRSFQEKSGLCVTLVEQENKGLLAARRAGFSAARGDYFISLDSDDALRPDALSILDSAISQSMADIVMYGYSRSPRFDGECVFPLEPGRLYGPEKFRLAFCGSNQLNAVWFKAVSRRCIGAERKFADFGRLNLGEDAIQSALIFDGAMSVYSVPETLYFYRPNSRSISSNVDYFHFEDLTKVHSYLDQFAKKWDMDRGDSKCHDALIARSAEELTSFVLHYIPSLDYSHAAKVLERVASTSCIEDCRDNRHLLNNLSLHSKTIGRLLVRQGYRRIWLLVKCASVFTGGR